MMTTRVVTIAHAEGAAGDSVGRGVAERMGFRYVDEQIIDDAAKRHGLDADVVADAERRRGLLARFFDIGAAPAAAAPANPRLETRVPRRDELQAFIIEAIHATAEAGNVVIAVPRNMVAIGSVAHSALLAICVPASPPTVITSTEAV